MWCEATLLTKMIPSQNITMAGDLAGCLNDFGDSPNLVKIHHFSRKSLLYSRNVRIHDQILGTPDQFESVLVQVKGRDYSLKFWGNPHQWLKFRMVVGSQRESIKLLIVAN